MDLKNSKKVGLFIIAIAVAEFVLSAYISPAHSFNIDQLSLTSKVGNSVS